MFGINDLWLFVISGLILNMLPGPDSLYIVGRSATQGFRAGSAAALGIGGGTIVHILLAAFGLSAILATSAMAFSVVKLVGAVYLLYMAYSMLTDNSTTQSLSESKLNVVPLKKNYYQGFLTNVLNPKVALFFLAFVPQFIDPATEDKAISFIVLGLIFNINGMIWCHFLAWSSSVASQRLRQNVRVTKWLKKLGGGLFAYFGLRLALTEHN